MKLEIEMKLSGSAFDCGFDESLREGSEIARILNDLASYFDGDAVGKRVEIPLMDINGNKCGTARIT